MGIERADGPYIVRDFRLRNCAGIRRGGRVAEGARLERVYTGNRIEGSNPSLSASDLREIPSEGQPPAQAIETLAAFRRNFE